MVPKHSAEVLCSVPKPKKAGMCLTESICVLDKLHSGMSYSALGQFSINESILNKHSSNKYIHETRLCVDQLMKM